MAWAIPINKKDAIRLRVHDGRKVTRGRRRSDPTTAPIVAPNAHQKAEADVTLLASNTKTKAKSAQIPSARVRSNMKDTLSSLNPVRATDLGATPLDEHRMSDHKVVVLAVGC
jgi:hypothetical protein